MPRHFLRHPLEQGGSPLPTGGRFAVVRASPGRSVPETGRSGAFPGKAGELRFPCLALSWRSGEAWPRVAASRRPAAAGLALGLFVQAFTQTASVAVHFSREGHLCGSTRPAAHRCVTGRAGCSHCSQGDRALGKAPGPRLQGVGSRGSEDARLGPWARNTAASPARLTLQGTRAGWNPTSQVPARRQPGHERIHEREEGGQVEHRPGFRHCLTPAEGRVGDAGVEGGRSGSTTALPSRAPGVVHVPWEPLSFSWGDPLRTREDPWTPFLPSLDAPPAPQ